MGFGPRLVLLSGSTRIASGQCAVELDFNPPSIHFSTTHTFLLVEPLAHIIDLNAGVN